MRTNKAIDIDGHCGECCCSAFRNNGGEPHTSAKNECYVPSGAKVRRPQGQIKPPDAGAGSSARLQGGNIPA